MTRTICLLFLGGLTVGCTTAGTGSEPTGELHAAAQTITARDVYDRVAFLASDELAGRNTPSAGLDTAAQWIADELASFGIEPAGEESWFQRYPFPAVGLDVDRTRFQVEGGATHTFAYGADFYARPGTGPAGDVGLVYVGRELSPDGAAQRGRVVVVRLPGLPTRGRRGWQLDREARARVYRTMARAGEVGAAAIAFVMDPEVSEADIATLTSAEETPSRSFGGVPKDQGPPAFFLRYDAGRRVFRMAGLDGVQMLARETLKAPVPLPGVKARLAAPLGALDDARPQNVVGVLQGRDPALRSTYVVVTAHMDHLGVGRADATGDSIYNGADDDASGTAVLVEVAEALATLPAPPRRSVLFLAVSGEEKGLLGSRWFTDHPTVPLDSIVANVNIDMVGRNAPDSIVVIGQEYSSLGPLVRRLAADHADLGLTVSEDLWPEERFFFRSDHYNFARSEIPALFFFAGTHEDYHRPGDELEEVDTDKTARVGRLVFYLTHAVAEQRTPPEWSAEGLATVRRLTNR